MTRARAGADSGGKYADRDRKLAAELGLWVSWRTCNPSECWSGERARQRVTAEPPSRDPQIHEWPSRGPARLDVRDEDREPTRGAFDDQDYGASDETEGVF
ncbi:MAG TPA: hypothetical protein VMI54_03825 [Polyangiaceae bacterium]|nr:hypothetical protein [Polyangiaceae bacterium]